MRTYEVRLAPAATSDDPVDASSLADFLAALQTLFYRVTREAADRADLGRTARSLERTSLMRVSWAHPGALTVLVGDPDTLEIDPLADRVDRWVAQLIAAMATNRRPGAVTNPIADATDSLIKAMKAPRVASDLRAARRRRSGARDRAREPRSLGADAGRAGPHRGGDRPARNGRSALGAVPGSRSKWRPIRCPGRRQPAGCRAPGRAPRDGLRGPAHGHRHPAPSDRARHRASARPGADAGARAEPAAASQCRRHAVAPLPRRAR